MARFAYKAKSGPGGGDIKEGFIEAGDRQNAVVKIVELGYIPLDVHLLVEGTLKTAVRKNFFSVFRPFSKLGGTNRGDVTVFLRQLYDLVDAEIPILRALQLIVEQTKNPLMKTILQDVRMEVQNGDSLSHTLSIRKDLFPPYLCAMIRAGEISGNLKGVLKRVCELVEKQEEVMARVKLSLVYPAVLLFGGFITIFIFLIFVIPPLATMFDDLDQELPLVTKLVISAGNFLSIFWWLPIVALVALFLWIKKRRETLAGKLFFDQLTFKVPLWGNFLKMQELERLARSMGIMLENGVEVVSALECSQEVVHNELIKIEVRKVSEAVIQGSSLAAAFRLSPLFPSAVISMVGVGEESGRIENGFLKWAETSERESERFIKAIVTLLEPMMIFLIGGLIGFMVIAMLLPIFRMNLVIQ